MHALLLIEIFNYRSIFAGERLEALFTAGIRQATPIENKSAAMTGFILRCSLMKRETENAQSERLGLTGQSLQFLRGQHALERSHQRRQFNRQRNVMQKPSQILHGERHALQKVLFAFVKSTKSVSSEGLQDAHIHVRVVMPHECFAIDFYV